MHAVTAWHDTARRLRAENVPVKEIAARLGVHVVSVYRATDPDYATRQRAAVNAANNRRYATDPAFRAERKQESGKPGRRRRARTV